MVNSLIAGGGNAALLCVVVCLHPFMSSNAIDVTNHELLLKGFILGVKESLFFSNIENIGTKMQNLHV